MTESEPEAKRRRVDNPQEQHLYKCKYVLRGHRKAVTAAKFSPNGKLLATCSADSTIRLWDARATSTGEPPTFAHLATLEGHVEGVSDVSWAPDSQMLASASDDKTVRVWNTQTNRVLRILTGHTHHVTSVDYNFKGNLIVSGSADENVRIWDVKQSKCLRILAAHSDPVSAVQFAPDGTMIGSASHDGLIRLWDTRTGQCLKTLVGTTKSPVLHVRFSPNGKYMLASTMDGCLRLWEYMRDKCVKTYFMKEGSEEFKYSSASVFLDDPAPMVCQGMGKHSIGIWDVQKKVLVDELTGHTGEVLCVSAFGSRLASASIDGTVRIWDRVDSS